MLKISFPFFFLSFAFCSSLFLHFFRFHLYFLFLGSAWSAVLNRTSLLANNTNTSNNTNNNHGNNNNSQNGSRSNSNSSHNNNSNNNSSKNNHSSSANESLSSHNHLYRNDTTLLRSNSSSTISDTDASEVNDLCCGLNMILF